MTYNWIWLIIGVVLAGVLYLCFTPVFNGFVDKTNELGADDMISQQTSNNVSIIVSLLLISPVIVLIGFLLAVYQAGVNEKKRSGGY